MTEAALLFLELGFIGPRPGSNFFPMLEIREGGFDPIPGEQLEEMLRAGHLTAWPIDGEHDVIKGGMTDLFGEVPDVELTFNYRLTPAGRSALATPSREGE